MDRKLKNKLINIHEAALSMFVPRTDKDYYGKDDYFALPSKYLTPEGKVVGDCDEFARYLWGILRSLGIPSRLLIINIEPDQDKANHMVVICRGTILDNRYKEIYDWRDKQQSYLGISSYQPNGKWYKLKAKN